MKLSKQENRDEAAKNWKEFLQKKKTEVEVVEFNTDELYVMDAFGLVEVSLLFGENGMVTVGLKKL